MVAPSLSRSTIDSRRRILRLLLDGEPLSRADLARRTRLNKPTVSNLIARLLEEGIVREVGSGASTGGRRPILLSINEASGLAIGIEIDAACCRVVLVDLRGTVLRQTEVRLRSTELEALLDAIESGIDRIRGIEEQGRVLGYGVAIPGLVDQAHDTVDCRASLGWADVPLRSLLVERLGGTVLVTDRGKAAGLGELWSLGKDRAHDLIYLYLGSGVGGAVLLGREIHWGVSNVAGEIGHMTVDPDGPRCSCSNRGCLEAHVSIPAILKRFAAFRAAGADSHVHTERAAPFSIDGISRIGELAAAGDLAASNTVAETARWLGIALGGLINALNPAAIVLGGPTADWGEVLTEAVNREIEQRTLPLSRAAVRIVTGQARGLAPQLGAAVLVLQEAADLMARSVPAGPVEQPWYSMA
jgi:predicted NBD/HSP70 family sugar kinase